MSRKNNGYYIPLNKDALHFVQEPYLDEASEARCYFRFV
ncbi:hypothetical protein ES707_06059 [subsurface metagenome]